MFWHNSHLISFELLSTEEIDTSKLQISVRYLCNTFVGVKIVEIHQPVTDIGVCGNTDRLFTSILMKLLAGKSKFINDIRKISLYMVWYL